MSSTIPAGKSGSTTSQLEVQPAVASDALWSIHTCGVCSSAKVKASLKKACVFSPSWEALPPAPKASVLPSTTGIAGPRFPPRRRFISRSTLTPLKDQLSRSATSRSRTRSARASKVSSVPVFISKYMVEPKFPTMSLIWRCQGSRWKESMLMAKWCERLQAPSTSENTELTSASGERPSRLPRSFTRCQVAAGTIVSRCRKYGLSSWATVFAIGSCGAGGSVAMRPSQYSVARSWAGVFFRAASAIW